MKESKNIMHPLLKEIVLENINNERIDDISNYLKTYNQPNSNFEDSAFLELKLYLMYLYNKNQKISSLYKNKNEEENLQTFPPEISFEQFKLEMKKLNLIATNRGLNLEQLVHNSFNRKIINLSGWFKIYADKIKGSFINQPTHRIYLAIDNSCLHKFALLIIKECERKKIAYQFKINNGNGENSADNVVIYANQTEVVSYIKSIKTILAEHPEIAINPTYLLAYPFDQTIAIAPYMDTKEKSYSEIVSDTIRNLRENASSKTEFISDIEIYLNQILQSSKILCHEIRKTLFNDALVVLEDESIKR